MYRDAIRTLLAAAAIGLSPLLATPTLAATPDPGVNARQDDQRGRIVQGVKSGELTRREANRLVEAQKRINRQERRYRSDGVLTKRERADLHRDLTRSSRRIYRQKHDGQSR